jgi:hypothetical protein
MARDSDRGREENAPAALTRRSSVWLIWPRTFSACRQVCDERRPLESSAGAYRNRTGAIVWIKYAGPNRESSGTGAEESRGSGRRTTERDDETRRLKATGPRPAQEVVGTLRSIQLIAMNESGVGLAIAHVPFRTALVHSLSASAAEDGAGRLVLLVKWN